MTRRARVRYMAMDGCGDVRGFSRAMRETLREAIGIIGSSKVKVKGLRNLPGDICVLRLVLYEPRLIDAVILSTALMGARPLAISGTIMGLMERLNALGYGAGTGDEANRPSLNR